MPTHTHWLYGELNLGHDMVYSLTVITEVIV